VQVALSLQTIVLPPFAPEVAPPDPTCTDTVVPSGKLMFTDFPYAPPPPPAPDAIPVVVPVTPAPPPPITSIVLFESFHEPETLYVVPEVTTSTASTAICHERSSVNISFLSLPLSLSVTVTGPIKSIAGLLSGASYRYPNVYEL
jgi:hypothetical protein